MYINQLQTIAELQGLTIKIQVREALGLNFFRVIVAEQKINSVKILGEMKGWTFPNKNGMQLDTLRILPKNRSIVSDLIWATTMAWALEKTNCRSARLLAIYDDAGYSKKLVRYFRLIGFKFIKEVGSSPSDILLRLIWGGAGTLMKGDCFSILESFEKKFIKYKLFYPA